MVIPCRTPWQFSDTYINQTLVKLSQPLGDVKEMCALFILLHCIEDVKLADLRNSQIPSSVREIVDSF